MSYEHLILHRASGKDDKRNTEIKIQYNIYDHEVEGVRFLFNQWRKWKEHSKVKPSGYCVLNFPRQSGKSVTTVLFVYAIQKFLHQPILILCKDDKQVQSWSSCFSNRSGFNSEDIVIEPTKALLKKKVFIKKIDDLGPFTKRSWSIIVVKGDEFSSLPHFPQAEFTVWLTSADLTKNLHLLNSIHNWIFPKVEFNINTYNQPKWKNKLIKHSMMESFVFRLNKVSMNSEHLQGIDQDNDENIVHTIQKRPKNKDPTGLKIKRSKVNIESEIRTNNDNDKLDVEAFIISEKPVISELDEHDLNFINNIEDNSVNETNDKCSQLLLIDHNSLDILNTLEDGAKNDNKIDELCTVMLENEVNNVSNTVKDVEIDVTKSEIVVEPEVDVDDENESLKTNIDYKCEVKECNATILEETTSDATKHVTSDVPEDNVVIKTEEKSPVKYESDLDSKLNEMQERAMKKFKGSFLDSIF